MKKALAIMVLSTIVGCSNAPSEIVVNETLRKSIGGSTIVSTIMDPDCACIYEGYISKDAREFTLNDDIFKVVTSSANAISYSGANKYGSVTWKMTEINDKGGKIEMIKKYNGQSTTSEYGTFIFK